MTDFYLAFKGHSQYQGYNTSAEEQTRYICVPSDRLRKIFDFPTDRPRSCRVVKFATLFSQATSFGRVSVELPHKGPDIIVGKTGNQSYQDRK